MIKKNQKSFYTLVGWALTAARQSRNMSIQQLANRSGEQHKTIRAIEAGEGQCSLHHAVWMRDVLGIDLNHITEGNSGKESSSKIVSGIDDLI